MSPRLLILSAILILVLCWLALSQAHAAPVLLQAETVPGAAKYQTCIDPSCTEQLCPGTAKVTSAPVVTVWLDPGTPTCVYIRAVDSAGVPGYPQRLWVTLGTLVNAGKQITGYCVGTQP